MHRSAGVPLMNSSLLTTHIFKLYQTCLDIFICSSYQSWCSYRLELQRGFFRCWGLIWILFAITSVLTQLPMYNQMTIRSVLYSQKQIKLGILIFSYCYNLFNHKDLIAYCLVNCILFGQSLLCNGVICKCNIQSIKFKL